MKSPIKWHGGKRYLASRILRLLPPHTHWVEPYGGSLAVTFAKAPPLYEDVGEVVGDVNEDLVGFWRVLRDPDTFARFSRIASCVPFSRAEWEHAETVLASDESDPVNRAVAFFVRVRQSMAGRRDTFAPLSKRRVRRGMNEQASAWWTAIDGLRAVHERLARVVIECDDALRVISREDSPQTCFYLDSPYLHETRRSRTEYGEHEMTEADHVALLDTVVSLEGKVILSGYPSSLYDERLKDWRTIDFDLPNNAASGERKDREIERLWLNYDPPGTGDEVATA